MSVSFNAAMNAYNNAAKFNAEAAQETAKSSGVNFSQAVQGSINGAVSSVRNAENTVTHSLLKQADITDVVASITDAELTLKAVVEIRDKLIAAHQEILKMPL